MVILCQDPILKSRLAHVETYWARAGAVCPRGQSLFLQITKKGLGRKEGAVTRGEGGGETVDGRGFLGSAV